RARGQRSGAHRGGDRQAAQARRRTRTRRRSGGFDLERAHRLEYQLREGHHRRTQAAGVAMASARDMISRKALPSEVETIADIGFVAWERDLMPFLSGAAASRQNERRRLSTAVHELLD